MILCAHVSLSKGSWNLFKESEDSSYPLVSRNKVAFYKCSHLWRIGSTRRIGFIVELHLIDQGQRHGPGIQEPLVQFLLLSQEWFSKNMVHI